MINNGQKNTLETHTDFEKIHELDKKLTPHKPLQTQSNRNHGDTLSLHRLQKSFRFLASKDKKKHISDRVEINKGVLQGDSLSPTLFVLALDSLLRRIIKKINLNFPEAEFCFQNILGFADDLCILSRDRNILKHFIQYTGELSQLSGLKINTQKTHFMGNSQEKEAQR
eukprot:maker-scaffold_126-snap-gene-0.13-mRNA-1 protein AED:0.36 eAED:0.60 QI:0/0/0/0.66/0/0/3/0/168